MRKIQWLIAFFLIVTVPAAAQKAEEKTYNNRMAGDVQLLKSWAEWNGKSSEKVFSIKVNDEARYYISALANLPGHSFTKIRVDGKESSAVYTDKGDWKWIGSELPAIVLKPGIHEIRIDNNSPMVPMIDEIFLHTNSSSAVKMPEKVNSFFEKLEILKKQTGDNTEKVLPNPEGNYTHAIDTAFTYSHFSIAYLNPGNHTIMTNSSTTPANLLVFAFLSFSYSGGNSGGGLNGEALLSFPVSTAGYYAIMLRSSSNNASGVCNIVLDGSVISTNAVIGGKRFSTPTAKAGLINFFTCRLTAGDTRLIVSRYSSSSARAYNDDYNGPGDFGWGYSSRIVKNFTGDEVQYAFVCAYSPTGYGSCDVYLANENSNVNGPNYPDFPLLDADDAIQSAPSSGYYNCISWSGGVTSTWIWPPNQYSTYNCTSSFGDLTCFDNFYFNIPLRYPGAQKYQRTGATNANSIVDLWKLGANYTHGSVRKPGNNHPHGFDWESKPGGLTRTFHPRSDLTNDNFGYGHIQNYYIFDPSAKGEVNYATDEDAVKAGVAIFDNAKLTDAAQAKLRMLTGKINQDLITEFNRLYEAWDKTKEKNAMYSDPAMYCKNREFEALASLSKKNARNVMILTMDKFVNSHDHFIGELLWTLSKPTYERLLTEVKQERTAKPNDEQGRYRIHGDHDNGVLYVEKILKDMQPVEEVIAVTELTTLTMSPNPVSDRYMVKLVLPEDAMVSVKVTYAQSRQVTVLQQPVKLSAGIHIFNGSINKGIVPSGEMITVQAEIDGEIKTIKAIVIK